MLFAGIHPWDAWIPAFAGMTRLIFKDKFKRIIFESTIQRGDK
jgi:hypothetical protein